MIIYLTNLLKKHKFYHYFNQFIEKDDFRKIHKNNDNIKFIDNWC